jgi:hypothetical protein
MQELEKLKDIKALEIINIDFTSYIIAIGLIVVVLLIGFLIYFYIKHTNKKSTKEQIAKKYLKNMSYNRDSKLIAYDFTLYGYDCINPKFKDEYETIVEKLEQYKYKKDVALINEDLISDIKEYIKVRL